MWYIIMRFQREVLFQRPMVIDAYRSATYAYEIIL